MITPFRYDDGTSPRSRCRDRAPDPAIPGARVGVDVGGTFTDIVVTDADGAIHTGKLPSTPDDFSSGVAEGVRSVLGGIGCGPGGHP